MQDSRRVGPQTSPQIETSLQAVCPRLASDVVVAVATKEVFNHTRFQNLAATVAIDPKVGTGVYKRPEGHGALQPLVGIGPPCGEAVSLHISQQGPPIGIVEIFPQNLTLVRDIKSVTVKDQGVEELFGQTPSLDSQSSLEGKRSFSVEG